MEGRMDKKTEEMTNRRNDGSKNRRKEGIMDGWKDGQDEERIQRYKEMLKKSRKVRDQGMEGRTDQTEVRTDEKTQKGGRDGRKAGWT